MILVAHEIPAKYTPNGKDKARARVEKRSRGGMRIGAEVITAPAMATLFPIHHPIRKAAEPKAEQPNSPPASFSPPLLTISIADRVSGITSDLSFSS
ncbi:hypothetical protein HPP92_019771 [Vanilla planifolia]|uniref:Uncharacterized protein n=1 Tax=Vanilla planifolia TaxID=51239 RepID=A0A835UL26_VANPL|nr:hypothetical protein HPP92_019771 [Vanilla planifolia]